MTAHAFEGILASYLRCSPQTRHLHPVPACTFYSQSTQKIEELTSQVPREQPAGHCQCQEPVFVVLLELWSLPLAYFILSGGPQERW